MCMQTSLFLGEVHVLCPCHLPSQIDVGASALKEQQRLVALHRGECEAILADREGNTVGQSTELQRARSSQAAAEAECALALVRRHLSG